MVSKTKYSVGVIYTKKILHRPLQMSDFAFRYAGNGVFYIIKARNREFIISVFEDTIGFLVCISKYDRDYIVISHDDIIFFELKYNCNNR